MADAGTPLIRAGDRTSEISAGAGNSDTPPATIMASASSSSRVELSDVSHGGYQSASDLDAPAIGGGARHGRRRSSSGVGRVVARLGDMEENAMAHANQPLLAARGHLPYALDMGALIRDSALPSERLHPLLSPLGSPESVVIDMVAHLLPEERAAWIAARWAHAQPEDCFVHAFSFLTPGELANVSTVNRAWSHAAYEPSLWTVMDLSALYTRVDDAFLTHLLGSHRFVHLRTLVLEGCSAITNKSIKAILYFCPNLRELLLTSCAHITNPWVLVELVKALPYLRRLELFGVTKEFGIVTAMLEARPRLDLGLFWREYCAENGMKLDGKGLADCRYDEGAERAEGPAPAGAGGAPGAGGRGCWGRVKGRIVYANDFYHLGGNYPFSVLYSCQNHAEQDFADAQYQRCHVCECLFQVAGESMWTELICRVCFDDTNLCSKKTWIPLDASSVRDFGLSEIVAKTIHVASRKNLPVSLRSFGTTASRLDYTLPEPGDAANEPAGGAGNRVGGGLGGGARAIRDGVVELDEDDEHVALVPQRIDPADVPMSTFVAVNGWRVDEAVHSLRGQLQAAANALNTRALLVYDKDENVEVLADKRVILDGKEGEEHMTLTVQAWHQALEILYPIVIVMILVLHFSVLFSKQTMVIYDGTTSYNAYIRTPTDDSLSPLLVLVIAVIGLVFLVICIFLVYRFREQCERCFKRFLVADILCIFMFGVMTMTWLLVAQWRAYMDIATFVGIVWNLSVIGLLSLYYPMPERLHHFFLVLLNAIMAFMMVVTLGRWLVLTFLLIFALGDFISELRPHRFLSPFIIPANVELLYTTPKILYTVGGLRLRAADLMCFGMLTGLGAASGDSMSDYADVLLGGALVFVCVMSSLALMLFVAPFIGCRFRPLPLAVVAAFILTMMQDEVLVPFLMQQNNLTIAPVTFK